MTSTPLPDDESLLDLLAKRATEGLTREEESQLQALLRSHPGVSADAFETTLATLDAAARPRESLPAALRARIAAQTPAAPRAVPVRSSMNGWWAAAACFVLAVMGWWPRIVSTPTLPEGLATLESHSNVVRVQLAAGPGASGAALAGDVIFDPATQTGYLRFHGIPPNDPRLAQYQLWIADGSRKQPEPVDGGVFDIPATTANGDIIIPFRAKLAVGAPAAFVITQEQPGGVVVSRQERVLALGKVST